MTFLQGFNFGQPRVAAGIAGHAPVASRTDGEATHLGTIGQTRALELLVEEATAEGLEPFLYRLVVVAPLEGLHGQPIDLGRAEPPAHHVIEEEVVQLIGTY